MEKTSSLEERELIVGLKNGSMEAFNRIYAMYAKRLYAYCLQYTHSAIETEEIVQDVFVQLWNSRSFIRQEETLRSLLFIMSKHHVINAFKARVASPVFEDYVLYQDMSSSSDVPSERLEYEEFVRRLQSAIKRLPDTQQKIIRLSRFFHLSNDEIAQQLNLSGQTVKNQLSLGLKALRCEIKKWRMLYWLLWVFMWR